MTAEPTYPECSCVRYVVDYSDPERYHPENVDREDDPNCPLHGRATAPTCPECMQGKHGNCTGWALNESTDDFTNCRRLTKGHVS